MAILIKDIVKVEGGKLDSSFDNFGDRIEELLQDGDYAVFVCNKEKNKSLSQIKYLFGIVLRAISDHIGGEQYPVNDLYRYYEAKFAPIKVISINGEEFPTQSIKDASQKELGVIIEQIIEDAERELGVTFPERKEVSSASCQELFVGAYASQWTDYNTNKI